MNKGKAIYYTTCFLTGMATYFMVESKFHITERIENKAKKLLGIKSPSEHTVNKLKEGLYAVDIVNDGRTFSEARTDVDKVRLSELLDAAKYRSSEDATSDNVVKLNKPEYIVLEDIRIKADRIETGKIPDENFENTNSEDE